VIGRSAVGSIFSHSPLRFINKCFQKWTAEDEIIKDGFFHGQLMFANPRGRIPTPDQRTGSAPGATAPGK